MALVNPSKAELSLSVQAEGIDDVKKTRDAIKDLRTEELALAKASKELAAAQAEQSAKLGKVGSGMMAAQHVVKDLSAGVGKLTETIGGSLSFFGPWGMAIGGVVAVFGQLWSSLSSGDDAIAKNKEEISKLAEAYRSLGDSATYAAAQQKVQVEDAQRRSVEELIARNQELEQIKAKIAESEGRQLYFHREYNQATESVQAMLEVRIAEEDRVQKDLIAQRDALEGYVATQQKALAEEKRAREEREDAETERQHLLAYYREQNQKREKELEDQKRAREKAAADAQKKREAEFAQLAALRQETEDQIFKASSASRLATLEREYEKKRRMAERDFNDSRLRAEALAQIETQRITALETERQRIKEEFAKKSAAIAMVGGEPPTQVEQAEAKWTEKRAKILGELAQLQDLQAQYEREFTASELSSSSEYLDLKQREIEAARVLADEQLKSYALIDEARKKDQEAATQAIFDQVYAEHALTKAQREAADAAAGGFAEMASGLEAWGIQSTAIQKMQMIASGIQAGADAIDYGAKGLAFFASGNPIAGAGMMAAAAGKTAAAAAYAAGVADLGGSAPRTASAPSSASAYSSASLTGSAPKESNEITVNFAFEGSDSQIASALIRGLNATTGSLGRQRLKKSVISDRV